MFLRVLHDALNAGVGASDLLLPRRVLGALLPLPALDRLRKAGAEIRLAHRVERIEREEGSPQHWRVDARRPTP